MKQLSWHKIAESIQEIPFNEQRIAVAEANGKKICIAHDGGALYGFAYKCPHAGGILAHGYLDAVGNVVCPLHRYKFSMRNGRNTSGEGYYLKTFPIEQRPDGIYVGMEPTGLFGW